MLEVNTHVELKTEPVAPSSPGAKGPRFPSTRRFARDGTTAIPNFLNGRDGEGRELSPQRMPVDSCTHTTFNDRLCGSSAPSLVQDISKSLMGRSTLVSTSERGSTPLSSVKGDSRFLFLQPPYGPEQLGPGSYDVEGGLPPLGLLPPDSPSCMGDPARDPNKHNSPFISPPRGPLFRSGEFSYITPYTSSATRSSFLGPSDRTPKLYKYKWQRPDVSDYRYATRHSEARKEVPAAVHDTPLVDSAGRVLTVQGKAQAIKPAAVPFMSKQPRFRSMQKERPAGLDKGSKGQHSPAKLRVSGYASHNAIPFFNPYASFANYMLPDERPQTVSSSRGQSRERFSRPASVM